MMSFSSGIYRPLDFGINIENDRSESILGKNSPENSENVAENSIPQSKERERKLWDVQSSSENVPCKNDISISHPDRKAARSPRNAVKTLKDVISDE